ncbi:MAG: hypothetical protein ABIH86_03150 [Planctomycetota bacterium]
MAKLSKTGRFIIIFLAFTAGALVAVVALSSGSTDQPLPWRTHPIATIQSEQPEIPFRCDGLATMICVELLDANPKNVRPVIYKRDADGQYSIRRDPLPKPPPKAPGAAGSSVYWRAPDGAYVLRFETTPLFDPVSPALSPSDIPAPSPSSFRIQIYSLGGKFVQ